MKKKTKNKFVYLKNYNDLYNMENKRKTIDKMVNYFTTKIIGMDMGKLDKVAETHNKLVVAYREHGFYNNEKPFDLYKKLLTDSMK